jgi:hypothetical protein
VRKIKLYLIFFSTVLLLSGCQNKDTEGKHDGLAFTDAQRNSYYNIGKMGVGEGYLKIRDNNIISHREYLDDEYVLNALALQKGSVSANHEYANVLYDIAIRAPKNSPSRKFLLEQAEHHALIGIKNYMKLEFITSQVAYSQKYYQDRAKDLKLFDELYNAIKEAQAEK